MSLTASLIPGSLPGPLSSHQSTHFCLRTTSQQSWSDQTYPITDTKSAIMPMPEDQAVVETAGNLVKTLQGAFSTPAGYRPGMQASLTFQTSLSATTKTSLTIPHSCSPRPRLPRSRNLQFNLRCRHLEQSTSLHLPLNSHHRPLLQLHRPLQHPGHRRQR